MPHPVSCRNKVLALKAKEGLSFAEVSMRFELSISAVFRWSKTLEPQGYRCKPWYKIDEAALRRDIEAYPDSYCHERAQQLGMSATGIRDTQYRLGITDKKPHYHPKADPEKRWIFSQTLVEVQKTGKPIVYLDESGFAQDMPRTHGDAMKGQRCDAQHDGGAKGRTNAMGALIQST